MSVHLVDTNMEVVLAIFIFPILPVLVLKHVLLLVLLQLIHLLVLTMRMLELDAKEFSVSLCCFNGLFLMLLLVILITAPSSLSVDEKCPTSCNLPPPSMSKM